MSSGVAPVASSAHSAGGRRACLSAFVAAIALTVTACASPPSTDERATARLDDRTNEIILPLSDYLVVDRLRDVMTFQAAERVEVGECMRREGFEFTAARVTEDPLSYPGDWSYGVWGEKRAARYGSGLAPSRVDAANAADGIRGGAAWSSAFGTCTQRVAVTEYPFIPTNDDTTSSLASRLATEAYGKAHNDPAWSKARARWWMCLKDEGLSPRTGDDEWQTEEGYALLSDPDAPAEERIRVSALEAHCNDSTHLAQTLGDIEASYQAPLIDANQAALNREKQRKQHLLRLARRVIDAHQG